MLGLRFKLLTCLCLIGGLHAIADDKAKQGVGPAAVENRVKESELTTIRLTADAERRLNIQLVAAERKAISLPHRLPGEVLIPPGRAIVVSAPVAGLLSRPAKFSSSLMCGQSVQCGDPLFILQPGETGDGKSFITADRINLSRAIADLTNSRIEAEGSLEQARVRVAAAEIKLKRADDLRMQGAGAQRAYDDARAELDLSTAQRNALQERVATISRVLSSLESSEQSAVTITAPLSGRVSAIHAAFGQVTPAGSALLEITAPDPVWIRVPIYVGELADVNTDANARVRGLTGGIDRPTLEAARVLVPGSADVRAATVNLFYEAANPNEALRPGQRVEVELPSTTSAESLVVPRAALLFDIHGGAWVYENTAPLTYMRKRVNVRDIVGDMVALERGIGPGARIVTAGAAELFGTEFGAGK